MERRTPLSRKTPLRTRTPLKAKASKPGARSTLKPGKGFTPASKEQRAKIADRVSIVSAQGPCDCGFSPGNAVELDLQTSRPGGATNAPGHGNEGVTSMQDQPTAKRYYRRFVAKKCETCGADFQARTDGPGRFCSRRCSADHQRVSKLKGQQRACPVCGNAFYAKRSEVSRGGGRYCSRPCSVVALGSPSKRPGVAEKIAEGKRGSKNPMWRGRDTYGSIAVVFNIRLKAESRCRNCGSTGGGSPLHLHHAVPRSMCKAGRRDLRNGVPLCARCHHGWHHRSITVYRDIFTTEEWAFISTLELLGQNITAWLDDRYPVRP